LRNYNYNEGGSACGERASQWGEVSTHVTCNDILIGSGQSLFAKVTTSLNEVGSNEAFGIYHVKLEQV